jgi:hypothetical protein
MTSVPPGILRTDEDVKTMRDQRAQAQARQQQAEAVQQGAVAAKNLSETNLESNNALSRMMSMAEAGSLTEGNI